MFRFAAANNRYMENSNDRQEESFLIYLDVNNLYGYAMIEAFPHNSDGKKILILHQSFGMFQMTKR